MKEYLEVLIAKKLVIAKKSNDLLKPIALSYREAHNRRNASRDFAFFITHHRSFIELLTLANLYCENFPDGKYSLAKLQKEADKMVRESEANLQGFVEMIDRRY